MKLDLHVHTNVGSSDSGLSPEQLVIAAKAVGLDGVCVTEHGTVWDKYQMERFSAEHDFLVIPGMEVSTDLGHITCFGLTGYSSGIHRAEILRRVVQASDGIMIAAHPFRRMFDDPRISGWSKIYSVEEAADLTIFKLTDELEVVNGANNAQENLFALKVARVLGRAGIGGSDAHSTSGIGYGAIVTERDVSNVEELIEEIREGRYYPTGSLLKGSAISYWDERADELGAAVAS